MSFPLLRSNTCSSVCVSIYTKGQSDQRFCRTEPSLDVAFATVVAGPGAYAVCSGSRPNPGAAACSRYAARSSGSQRRCDPDGPGSGWLRAAHQRASNRSATLCFGARLVAASLRVPSRLSVASAPIRHRAPASSAPCGFVFAGTRFRAGAYRHGVTIEHQREYGMIRCRRPVAVVTLPAVALRALCADRGSFRNEGGNRCG